jgi:hypothetical protein
MLWISEPAFSDYGDGMPLFPPLFSLLLIFGIVYTMFVSKKSFLYILLGFVFVLPFTNSAMTDAMTLDHRLLPFLPIGMIFVAFGIEGILNVCSNRILKNVCIYILGLYIVYQIFTFFYLQKVLKGPGLGVKDYLSMHSIYVLKSLRINSSHICLYVSQTNADNLSLGHYVDQYQYFLPQYERKIRVDQTIRDNEAYVYSGDCPNNYYLTPNELRISCNGKMNFQCPIDYIGDIIIHY